MHTSISAPPSLLDVYRQDTRVGLSCWPFNSPLVIPITVNITTSHPEILAAGTLVLLVGVENQEVVGILVVVEILAEDLEIQVAVLLSQGNQAARPPETLYLGIQETRLAAQAHQLQQPVLPTQCLSPLALIYLDQHLMLLVALQQHLRAHLYLILLKGRPEGGHQPSRRRYEYRGQW